MTCTPPPEFADRRGYHWLCVKDGGMLPVLWNPFGRDGARWDFHGGIPRTPDDVRLYRYWAPVDPAPDKPYGGKE